MGMIWKSGSDRLLVEKTVLESFSRYQVPFVQLQTLHVAVSYSTSSLRVFIDGGVAYFADLTPGMSTVLSFSFSSGQMRVLFGKSGNEFYRLIFYGIVFLPLGLLLGFFVGGNIVKRSEQLSLISVLVTVQSFAVQDVLSAGGSSVIDGSSFATEIVVACTVSLLALIVVAWSNKRYASCNWEFDTSE